jgi:hypothetical protein
MSSMQQTEIAQTTKERGSLLVAVSIAVALSIACCTLILLIPTESITVDTVYQGF